MDDLVEIYDQHENMEQILDYHHTSIHEMIFRDFHLPKPKKYIYFLFSKLINLTSISSSKLELKKFNFKVDL
jgi:hypothetical protein